jgi:hypothetical protein
MNRDKLREEIQQYYASGEDKLLEFWPVVGLTYETPNDIYFDISRDNRFTDKSFEISSNDFNNVKEAINHLNNLMLSTITEPQDIWDYFQKDSYPILSVIRNVRINKIIDEE